ncbi:SRPBCC domain-containing protein [Mucilaginibacter sp. L3T2-6]|uniref:SRPBCC family protein n=1 Tax=Mucilaginibacter sp. L3T2-6 TaxID=3062491 RepID=UPI00267476C0|nr:SRPBCC domain-containing protein [Mucilaginibacter sp. L3T2-6]MDO3640977.1 SRPBCC domain-containing protein [Mucilaginibacter sp. L3T2-6]MDV6213547.1 SRPBCC domain-containing protein [Mucilaginibacter sp. L3T2-6]
MADNKWSSFKIAGDFDTDIRSLYEAWATTEGVERWFLRKANFYTVAGRIREPEEFILTEDTYEWYWHGWGDDAMEKGQILEANGTDTIKFTFSGGSVVTVYIHSRNGISVVDLTQENIPEEPDLSKNLYVQCQLGWTFYLANLKSVIEGGLDLRNKRVDLPSIFK